MNSTFEKEVCGEVGAPILSCDFVYVLPLHTSLAVPLSSPPSPLKASEVMEILRVAFPLDVGESLVSSTLVVGIVEGSVEHKETWKKVWGCVVVEVAILNKAKFLMFGTYLPFKEKMFFQESSFECGVVMQKWLFRKGCSRWMVFNPTWWPLEFAHCSLERRRLFVCFLFQSFVVLKYVASFGFEERDMR